ncbi:hypothetical protein [Amycolatopsis sp.]|uniref:hypothetical protein n=1 Tax=Amycolatopsis sp. TaxID=37632 RepID=UPI002C68C709|nr:hypothetical protein [Amycolatopsis sp.]HVV09800.1 hypothetical protein [Amycolatopsis sp.]
MEFEAVSDELFGAKREEFTALRDERAKQARPDRALADRIAGLRKPTVAAWLVNQVSRVCPEEIEQLAELGEALRRAHQNLSGADLRSLSRQRHEVIDRLGKRAQWLARKAGYAFSDAAERQIADTFEAAVSDPQALEAVRAARLSAALTPGSPEQWLTAAVMPERKSAKPRPKQAPESAKKPAPSKAERERQRREEERLRAEREKAQREAEEADEAEESAEQALRDAEREADEADAAVADLRARLDEAVEAKREKHTEVTNARKELTAAQRAAERARRRAAEFE